MVDDAVLPAAAALRDAARDGDFDGARERAHELMIAANAVQAFCLPAPPPEQRRAGPNASVTPAS